MFRKLLLVSACLCAAPASVQAWCCWHKCHRYAVVPAYPAGMAMGTVGTPVATGQTFVTGGQGSNYPVYMPMMMPTVAAPVAQAPWSLAPGYACGGGSAMPMAPAGGCSGGGGSGAGGTGGTGVFGGSGGGSSPYAPSAPSVAANEQLNRIEQKLDRLLKLSGISPEKPKDEETLRSQGTESDIVARAREWQALRAKDKVARPAQGRPAAQARTGEPADDLKARRREWEATRPTSAAPERRSPRETD
jgi:hypothetical protein